MKFFGLLGIYRTGSWIKIGSIYELGQKLILSKILKNPSKSCDFERVSRFCAILIGFCLFWDFAMDLSRWSYTKSQKPGFWDLSRVFDNNGWYILGLNMFLVLTFCAPLKNNPYISLNVFKILTFYLCYKN